ncbi:hypothetical protein GCM10019016_039080 [Streptomyces prasinosporus]|uniref:Tryptophan synthase subunit(Beta) n=1 Tax=Streptomyces prasinosporus TaxID=68256 RepID=A0ABP6TNE0_9ACTN
MGAPAGRHAGPYGPACPHRFRPAPPQRRRAVCRVDGGACFVEARDGPGTRSLRHRLAERARGTDAP